MAKTYYLEKHGIRVDGCRTKTEAKKQWEAARDEFVDRATACPPWIFAVQGHTLIVMAEPYANSWSYRIVRPTDLGRQHASCCYSAPSQIAAIAVAIGALAQTLWAREIRDDGAFFDDLVAAARLTDAEAARERSDFITVTAYWRNNPINTAA